VEAVQLHQLDQTTESLGLTQFSDQSQALVAVLVQEKVEEYLE
tara:strand:- start:311 stop:439 length:129 start_codon:yes stop_codon:yes gene_type:complete